MSFSRQKGEFDRFFNRLDRPVEESRPYRQPDRPVDPTGADRPDRFPSLQWRLHIVFFIADRQPKKLWMLIFIVFGLIQPRIEPKCTVPIADTFSTRPMIG